MAITLTLYCGAEPFGKDRRAALKREAKRQGKSAAHIVWDALAHYAISQTLRDELIVIEGAEAGQ